MRDRFLRACCREPVDCTPIWLMRQAGRYLPEYRELRARYSMLDLIRAPELAVEISLSDILPPLESIGVEVKFVAGDGPVIPEPVRTAKDVERLRKPSAEEIA